MVNPFVHATWVAAGLFLVFLGLLVFATRPAGALNRVLGALLVLRGASDLFYELMRDSTTAGEAFFFLRVANWYDWPTLFLTLLFLHLVWPPLRYARTRRALLAVAGGLTTLLVASFALEPSLISSGVRGDPRSFYGDSHELLTQAYVAIGYAIQLAAVLLAGGAVSSRSLTSLQRRRAALIGLAFGVPLVNAGLVRAATLAASTWKNPGSAWLTAEPVGNIAWLAGGLVAAVGFFAFAHVLPRLASAFDGRARQAALGVGVLVLLGGALDTAVILTQAAGFSIIKTLGTPRYLVIATSAACLALALVRYGLAGFGAPTQRRVAAVAKAAVVGMLVLLPAGLALAWVGAGSLGLIVGLVLALGALTLAPAPLRAASVSLSHLLLVSPSDPSTAAERARRYTAELERRRSKDGRVPPAQDGALVELRQELGLREEDHAMLAGTLPDPARAEPPLLGRYRIERELGRGAFGTALLATDVPTGQRVVLKRFHADTMEQRALAEARALAAVRHPRVIPLLAVERVGQEVFLVLAYAEGGTAQQLVDRDGPTTKRRALALVADVLEGLEAVHGAGLAHGDVKLDNILLDAEGRALVGDLGSARPTKPAEEGTLTAAPVLGSLATMAPEVLRGARRSPAGDVYACGATLYRLLTGEHYLDLAGKDWVGATEAILHGAPRLPHRRVPSALAPVVAKALAKDPAERFPSAGAMRAALLDAAGGDPAPRSGPSDAPSPVQGRPSAAG